MITKLYIDNFKSLSDFSLTCSRLTGLIGVNNSGKSTILQALDFLCAVSQGNVTNWLKGRDWKAGDIRSRLEGRPRFTVRFELQFTLGRDQYSWRGVFNTTSILCSSELVTKNSQNNNTLLKVEGGKYRFSTKEDRSIDFAYEGSILASLKKDILSPELNKIRRFLQSMKSLELLSPLLLRKRARTTEGDLGLGGEKLSAFLFRLSPEKKSHILSQMQHLFPPLKDYLIQSLRSGWKELWIHEQYKESLMPTEARHISDGFLRILAIFSQLQTDHSILLFDEIEDGLNHELMEYLMDEIVNTSKQIFFTTHSPMILNFLDDHTAKQSVMLIYRDPDTGRTKACRFFDIDQNNRKLEYMGPGEVFANVDLRELP
ncbi:MAG: AAA family ATPase [Pseudomonadota bacterium]